MDQAPDLTASLRTGCRIRNDRSHAVAVPLFASPRSTQSKTSKSIAMKLVIVLLLGLILASLASSLFFLIRDPGDSDRAVRALSVRIGLSIAVFVLIGVAFALGWIEPRQVVGNNAPTQADNTTSSQIQ